MGGENVQETKEILTAIARVEQDVKYITSELESFKKVQESAIRNDESIRSAHKRIDDVEDSQKWIWRAFGAAVIAFIFDKLFI